MRRLLEQNKALLQLIESTLVMLAFVQGLRFLIGALYSRVASASIVATVQVTNPDAIQQLSVQPGFVLPEVVGQEISLVVYMAALPIIAILIGRFRSFLLLAAVLTMGARSLMFADTAITATSAAAVTVGTGLLFLTLLVRHRMTIFAPTMILAMAGDQLFRAAGNTLDITWDTSFFETQMVLYGIVLAVALINVFGNRVEPGNTHQDRGLITIWGGVSLGAMLFLQLSLLSTANAIVGRADVDYDVIVPVLIGATLLPLFPPIRGFARTLIGMFDAAVRGWVWLLLVFLLLVLGTRFTGLVAGIGFVGAQFAVSMWWWWLVRPQGENERNVSGLWVTFGMVLFALLIVFDLYTYEYAYVTSIAPLPFGTALLNNTIIPLLRGFRGFGYAVILFAALLAALPMIQTQRRIAWRVSGSTRLGLSVGLLFIAAVAGGAYLASPPLIVGVSNPTSLRVGTYNVHGGYTEFYAQSLEEIAQTIERSGANVVLLQEVEAGRLTSFGVDQPLWLARRLGMDRRFFPTNEGLQGLAVLSNVPIVFDDGEILPSIGQQTGLQRVQVQPAPDEIVTIYNTWLGLLVVGEDIEQQEADQQRQLDQIVAIIGQHHPDRQLGRTVLGGTFNNVPDSDLIQSIDTRGFSDPFAGSTIERSATLRRTGVNARVDYVWIYPELAEGVGVIDSNASDHRLAFVSVPLQ